MDASALLGDVSVYTPGFEFFIRRTLDDGYENTDWTDSTVSTRDLQ